MRKLTVLLLAASGLAFSFVSTGCSSGAAVYRGLKVTVEKLERDSSGAVHVELVYQNPNLAVYNVAESDHRIFLNEKYVGSLVSKEPVGVPAQGSERQRGVVTAKDPSALQGMFSQRTGSQVAYRVESKLRILDYADNYENVSTTSAGAVTLTAGK